ncbi:MAG TPA: hypothetical protein ENI98_12765 [Gammaproteobacteria bacterium]|nr:hypothetical protein [Gammaproteobacteria bacterium]
MLKLIIKLYGAVVRGLWEPASSRVYGELIRARGVILGRGAKIYGMPIISLYKGSDITVGDQAVLRSSSRGNAIGVNHPIVIRTLWHGASIRIGDNFGMSGGAICAARNITIGNNVMIGANTVIADTDFHDPLRPGQRGETGVEGSKDVRIEDEVWIGADVYVCKGVVIGRGAVIGAKSVVTKSIPPNCVAVGVPARVIRKLDGMS